MSTTAKLAEAGPRGEGVRSDLNVTVEVRESGGLELALESRVEPYYGEAIRDQARQVLGQLDVRNARVSLKDEGALPFTIAARIEAAVKRAGLAAGKQALPEKVAPPTVSARDRLRR